MTCACSRRRLDATQSSLVFINTCFALAFGGVFFLLTDFFAAPTVIERVAYLSWAALATYLIIVVWRQYTTYYIPLQFYSQSLESLGAELSTFIITLVLGLIAISASKAPMLGPVLLIILILLNLVKLREMRITLRRRLPTTKVAVEELRHLARKLRLNLFFLSNVLMLLCAYHHFLQRGVYSIIVVAASFLLHAAAQPLYRNIYVGYEAQPELYSATIAIAWPPE